MRRLARMSSPPAAGTIASNLSPGMPAPSAPHWRRPWLTGDLRRSPCPSTRRTPRYRKQLVLPFLSTTPYPCSLGIFEVSLRLYAVPRQRQATLLNGCWRQLLNSAGTTSTRTGHVFNVGAGVSASDFPEREKAGSSPASCCRLLRVLRTIEAANISAPRSPLPPTASLHRRRHRK